MSDDSNSSVTSSRRLAVLPLRDVVVYPHMVVPLFVGRKPSISALEDAMAVGKEILLVAQRKPEVDEPEARDIYRVGTLATVLQMMKMPDNTVKVMVQGALRARLKSLKSGKFFSAEFEPIPEDAAPGAKPEEREALRRSLLTQFESYVKLHKNVPPEALAGVSRAGRHRAPGRHHRRAHAAGAGKEAGRAGNRRPDQAHGVPGWTHGQRDRHAQDRAQDPRPREDANGKKPARVLPERADEGHPEGTGRARRGPGRNHLHGKGDQGSRHAQGGAGKGHDRAGQAQDDGADVGRGHGGAELPGLVAEGPLEETAPHQRRPGPG